MSTIERPVTGIWHELLLGPGSRRVLWGFVLAVAGPAAMTPLVTSRDLPVGLLIVPVVLATLVGRLWPGLLAALEGFLLSALYVSPPSGSFSPMPSDVVALALFVGAALLGSVEEAARARAREVQERLVFLAEANRVVTTSLDEGRTLAGLAELAVPRLADWCAVLIRGPDDTVAAQEVAHSDADKVRLARELWDRYPVQFGDPEGLVSRVFESGRPLVLGRISQSLLQRVARDEKHLQILRDLQLRSAIVVPLRGRHGPIGVLVLVYAESGRRYSQADVTFVEELAQTASMALENTRLHRERSHIAQTLQNSLLPPDLPEIPGVEVAVRYRPAGEGNLVGGDFYDLFDVGREAWAVALGDVCGKGPEAAALTGLVRHTIRSAAVRRQKPSEVLSLVNRQILHTDGGRFCTVTMGAIERTNGNLNVTVSCGGHPSPLIVRPSKSVEAADCLGTLLGVFTEPELGDSPVLLEPGDAIVFYTDGVVERFEREGEAGDARLVSLLWETDGLDATGIADKIYREALDERGVPRDDMAVVVLRLPA
ncbi:MAG: SpoIIE family protein phosphatase [Actinomycetota bacterium]|nr:SpoIIE family protein phosphatase [Actinomycetota bacterium]